MADLTTLREKLSRRVQPTEPEYQFSDTEFNDEIEEAVLLHDSSYTVETLPKEEEHFVLWLAMVSCYYILASKQAENMRFRIENDEYHGHQPHLAYIRLAKQYEDKYAQSGGTIEVGTVTRRDVGTGEKVGFYGDEGQ